MTVGELLEYLEDFDESTEVRLAMQPNWPFEYSIGRVVEVDLSEADPDDPSDEPDEDAPTIVYLGEGAQLGYLPSAASCELGWR